MGQADLGFRQAEYRNCAHKHYDRFPRVLKVCSVSWVQLQLWDFYYRVHIGSPSNAQLQSGRVWRGRCVPGRGNILILECQWCIQVLQMVLQGLQAMILGKARVSALDANGPAGRSRCPVPDCPQHQRLPCLGFPNRRPDAKNLPQQGSTFSLHLFPF